MHRNYKESLAMSHQFALPKESRLRPSPSPQPRSGAERDFRLHELASLAFVPVFRAVHHWWLQRVERHYLICADVELQRAREAQMNVAYYQKRAALARSARN